MKRKKLRIKSLGRLSVFALLFLAACALPILLLTQPAGEEPDEELFLALTEKAAAPASANAQPLVINNSPTPTPVDAASGESMASPSPSAETPAPSISPVPSSSPTASPAASISPVASPSPTPTATANTADLPYYLYLEKGSYTLTIYEKDANGEYTKVYRTYRVAHGGNKTPAGVFPLLGAKGRERWHEFPDGGFAQYASSYHSRLYLHSPLYGAEDAKMMWPKYYDGELGIGNSSTGGCIRMVTEAARFVYENCPEGTIFEIVNGSPKNTSSIEPPSRNGLRYDPTDVNITS